MAISPLDQVKNMFREPKNPNLNTIKIISEKSAYLLTGTVACEQTVDAAMYLAQYYLTDKQVKNRLAVREVKDKSCA